jgi:hypothetical protein
MTNCTMDLWMNYMDKIGLRADFVHQSTDAALPCINAVRTLVVSPIRSRAHIGHTKIS